MRSPLPPSRVLGVDKQTYHGHALATSAITASARIAYATAVAATYRPRNHARSSRHILEMVRVRRKLRPALQQLAN